MGHVPLEKGEGKDDVPFRKERNVSLDECGTGSGPVPCAVPTGPCSGSLCAAIISLSLTSVGFTALMAESKSYISMR